MLHRGGLQLASQDGKHAVLQGHAAIAGSHVRDQLASVLFMPSYESPLQDGGDRLHTAHSGPLV